MPQASSELQDLLKKYFGDSIDNAEPTRYLISQGYKLNKSWCWEAPIHVLSLEDLTQKEWECMLFLRDEWDFGMLA